MSQHNTAFPHHRHLHHLRVLSHLPPSVFRSQPATTAGSPHHRHNLSSSLFEDAMAFKATNQKKLLVDVSFHSSRMMNMLSAQTTYYYSISEDSCQKRKQIRSEAAD
ncbi:hypothetical protein L2E82_50897 [Cichorium intybus]|nr:hypothetical protein L2E82_50897 [Cichorium intybus]